ncbi:MAG: radical SAM protein, partial [Bacteroidales bacterium]
MKKVLLVNTNTEIFPYPVPPLGLCLLAGIIEKRFSIRIYDGLYAKQGELSGLLADFQPDYIGIGIRNIDDMVIDSTKYYIDQIYKEFILPVKQYNKARVILGGSGFSIFPYELMSRFGINMGIVGEAEESLPLLLKNLEEKKEITSIPGVVVAENTRTGCCVRNNFKMENLPDAKIDKYIRFIPDKANYVYPVQTKRGCSNRCIYCTYPGIEGRKYRFRKAADVADEIEQVCHRLGSLTFEFVDSTFNDPPGWAEEICRQIIKRKIKARFRTMGINPAHASHELFSLMIRAGFTQIDCTPDSASQKMLSNLGKNFAFEKLGKCARLLYDFDLPTMWFFTFGGPGETEETIRETLGFVEKRISTKDMVHMTTGLRIYPNTPLHRIALEEQLLNVRDSLLKPCFYISGKLGKKKIDSILTEAISYLPNCIPAAESNPSPEMLSEAYR